jgi:hypothetical protein
MRGIAKGLTKSDWVVIAGLQNATPGGAVAPKQIELKTNISSLAPATPATSEKAMKPALEKKA